MRAIGFVLAPALLQCGAPAGEHAATSSAAILGGVEFDDAASPVLETSPVLFLNGPQGYCSATLLAPRLAVTAHHCVADLAPGAAICTPSGELATNSPGGAIGADDSPGDLHVFAPAHLQAGLTNGAPDTTATMIFSSTGTSTCLDDIAFIVLGEALSGPKPAAVRLQSPTAVDESVAVWGYGLTDKPGTPPALRVRDPVMVVGIGPDQPTTLTQEAPVRAVRLGPGSMTCSGDSGGPVISDATGAVIAIVSSGIEAGTNASCPDVSTEETTGPRLAEYYDLAMKAFAAAGATAILEAPDAGDDGGNADGGDDASDLGDDASDGGDDASDGGDRGDSDDGDGDSIDATPDSPVEASSADGAAVDSAGATYLATGGGCTAGTDPPSPATGAALVMISLAMTAVAIRRRAR